MKPLKEWGSYAYGYRFKQPTFYSSVHLGLDVMCPAWTPVFAPFDGVATSNPFPEGGNVIDYRANGFVFRFLHLARIVKTGNCKAGDLIAYTGNTGTLSRGAHLHLDISRNSVQVNNINNFLNPETFNWGEGVSTMVEVTEANKRGWDETANEVMGYDGRPMPLKKRVELLEGYNKQRADEINALRLKSGATQPVSSSDVQFTDLGKQVLKLLNIIK